jgi:hypothetical protein
VLIDDPFKILRVYGESDLVAHAGGRADRQPARRRAAGKIDGSVCR